MHVYIHVYVYACTCACGYSQTANLLNHGNATKNVVCKMPSILLSCFQKLPVTSPCFFCLSKIRAMSSSHSAGTDDKRTSRQDKLRPVHTWTFIRGRGLFDDKSSADMISWTHTEEIIPPGIYKLLDHIQSIYLICPKALPAEFRYEKKTMNLGITKWRWQCKVRMLGPVIINEKITHDE